jgi:hypothetical protein
MFKLILNLIASKAPAAQWRLRIGSHLLKKGCGYKVGQIIESKHLRGDIYRVRVITSIFYDFHTNSISHTSEKKIVKYCPKTDSIK